jgi:cation:H+ antiporter
MLRRVVFAAVKVVVGLSVLVGSSHILVWGAVDIANFFKVDELIIGLTIVAVGTSLPELASAIAAARHGEHEFVLGNIIGSNFFNTLAVTGIAAFISPVEHVSKAVVQRDIPVMMALSLSILLFGINFKNFHDSGVAGRFKGLFWLAVFVVYTIVLLYQGV